MSSATVLILLALPLVVLTCQAGTGSLGKTGVFKFSVSPAVGYTFSANISQGQISEAYAKSSAERDARNAIYEVLRENSLPTNDVEIKVDFTPPNTPLLAPNDPCDATVTAALYQVIDGAVLYKCLEGSLTSFTIEDDVTVTASQPIYESQWRELGLQIVSKLEAKGSKFQSTSVSVTN
ncbi:unnamed protein product [Caenorhabditis auriculariae]|uniref:Uncharacterized protein n=1 Tax=Caenorhabditis auriculariae TaxID=2777116 RepID=A0A8S1H7J6_9PELO|nr:unnamed protein product [Caenorhabditis auriculariae]